MAQVRLRRTYWLLALAILVVVSFLSYRIWMAQATVRLAKSQVNALVDCDVDRLWAAMAPFERQSGMSREKLATLVEIVSEPARKHIVSKGEQVSDGGAGNSDGGASSSRSVLLTNGNTAFFSVVAHPTEFGPTYEVSRTVVGHWWRIRAQLDGMDPTQPNFKSLALLRGIREDRAKLEAAGITGIYGSAMTGFQTWDEFERAIGEFLRKYGESAYAHKPNSGKM